MNTCPTHKDLVAAFDAGERIVLGLPCTVKMASGGVATLDLVAKMRGDIDPWYVCEEPAPGVVLLRTAGDMNLSVGGLAVGADDLGAVLAALRTAPARSERHSAAANEARMEAGKLAMLVRDNMVRGRMLDAIDGWSAVLGKRLDTDEKHGDLHEPADREMRCRLLSVVCPSTGRRYVLRVPTNLETAKAARLWTMRGIDPKVES